MATQPQFIDPSRLNYAHGRQLATQLFMEAMSHLDVGRAMRRKIQFEAGVLIAGPHAISVLRPPRVVAFGKAANAMARVMTEILGGMVEAGVCASPQEPTHPLEHFQHFTGGHPFPNRGSVAAAQAALRMVAGLTADDLVIFLVSGGGSALFETPLDPAITLADMVELNRLLVTSDLPIQQINILRKHLSAVKGGRLAARCFPARQLTLYISDVPDDQPSMVASGPTMPDESTAEEAYRLAEQAELTRKLPAHIRDYFERRTLPETPKPGDPQLSGSRYFCLLSNHDAVLAAEHSARALGFSAVIDSGPWDADFQEVADSNLAHLEECRKKNSGAPTCLIVGGEVTCPVTGHGIGGRNQAFALYAASRIAGQPRVVLSAGTDGRDGNSPACGAVADGHTVTRAQALGIDPSLYLVESDSYHFFRTLGDTLDTGYTGNNVRDLRLWLDFS
jgi:glycerate 2-kinase